MSVEERYIHNVMRKIWASPERIERLETDLRAHFKQATEAGEPATSVVARLGDPADVASEFMKGEAFHFAGFFERLFAFFADIGVIAAMWLPVMLASVAFAPWAEQLDGSSSVQLPVILGILMIGSTILGLVGLGVFYFPVLEKRFGKTPGKHIMGLRVRDETGAEIRWGQAFLRRISLYFEFLVLDALFVPFTKRKQRAFDIVADTVVLRESRAGASVVRYFVCLAVWLPTAIVFTAMALLFATQ